MKDSLAGVVRALAMALPIAATSPTVAAGVDELPKTVQDELYNKDRLDPQQPIGESAYRDFVAKRPPPWTIGYASSYAGNTWRADVMNRLQNTIIPKWKKLGLIKDVIITQSNLNDSTQIQQMRQLVDRGVDAIIVCCSNPTALNQTVKYAHDRGVPVFSATGYLTSPYSVGSSANFVVGGEMLGDWMANEIHGKGNVLVVVQLDGGNDGINTVVPFKDEGYARHRKAIRLPEKRLIKVSGEVGLHPARMPENRTRRYSRPSSRPTAGN